MEGIVDKDNIDELVILEDLDEKEETKAGQERPRKKLGALRVCGRVVLVLATFVLVTFVGAYATLWTICHGESESAKKLFVSTILETGALQFLASWYFTEEEILAITNENSMGQISDDVDKNMITIPRPDDSHNDPDEEPYDPNGIELIELTGRTYLAKLLVINDPSRVKLATIYPWSPDDKSKRGQTLEELVKGGDYLAGINGGEYYSDGNWGGKPKGLVVCGGELQYNAPQWGDVMVGFNEDDVLVIKDIGQMNSGQVEAMVKEERIRDAVSFKDAITSNSNHFTKLIINGTAREISGNGSGANPRTAIGQREDGSVLLLVTDGRGSSGHLGATAADLISIMQEYGAVNAANLDGGSSSAMYYNDAYEMTSVTLYYATSSWQLPTAYVVEKRGD